MQIMTTDQASIMVVIQTLGRNLFIIMLLGISAAM
jgi:hypothetical protein